VVDPADTPMGAWAEAIDHLHEAERLMAEMVIDLGDGTPSHNLGQIYRHYVSSAERAIQHHWRTTYFAQASKMPKARVDANGHMKFLDDET
jgi:hypothetical protein